MKVTLPKSALRAAALCAAKDKYELRYYMKGVYLRFSGDQIAVAATDGHILFVGKVSADESEETPGAAELIVPLETIKAACKGRGNITLESAGDRFTLGDTEFTPIDGKFPDFWKVIPAKVSGGLAQYNPDLLIRGQKALCEFHDSNKPIAVLLHNGDSAGVMEHNSANAVVIVMPMRGGKQEGYVPFTMMPAAEEKATA